MFLSILFWSMLTIALSAVAVAVDTDVMMATGA